MEINAVIFDFWFTLVTLGDSEELEKLKRLRLKAFSHILSTIPPEHIERVMEEVEEDSRRIRTTTNREVSSKEIINKIIEKLNVNVQYLEPLHKAYDRSLFSIDILPQKDSKETLSILKEKKYKIGLVSNTSHGENVRKLLKKFDFLTYFDALVFSDEFGIRKPRKEIFLKILSLLNTLPSQAIHIGDRADYDVLGAKFAGLLTVHFNPDSNSYPEDFPHPDFTIKELKEVIKILGE